MLRFARLSVLVPVWIAVLAGGPARGENEGQADLDKATERKLTAGTLEELGEVIRLLESAIDKGLTEENARFANDLLASTLVERATIRTRLISRNPPSGPHFTELRKLALADLERSVKLSPRQPQALLRIARLNVLPGGDRKRAAEALEAAITSSADQPELRAKALLLRGMMQQDVEQKLADLDEAIRLVPHDPTALRSRGLLLAQQGKLESALRDFRSAIELAPEHAPTYEVQALVLSGLKRYDEALVALDKAHELQPNSAVPLMQKARVHSAQENYQAALIDLDLARSIAPESVEVLLLRAGVHQELEQAEKALADVDEALKLRPAMPAAMRLRAMLLAESEKFEEAIAELEKLRRIQPEDVTTLLQLGVLYNAQKQFDRAVEAYSGVLARQPDHSGALRGRGDSLLNAGKQEEALADYEKAIKLQPKDPGLLNNLAWVLATSPDEKLRDGQRAVRLASEACELTDYRQVHILSTLAAAYAEQGDFKSAIKWAEKGLRLATDEEDKEPLGKELSNYRGGKPWRELLSGGEPVKLE